MCARKTPARLVTRVQSKWSALLKTRESIFWQHQMALLLPLSFQSGVSTSSEEEEDWLLTAGRDWTRSEKTAEGTFRSLIFIRGCSVYMEAVTSLFKSFQPAFRWETESSSNVYAQESRWGTFEMDFISGQKKCSFNQCVSACVCVCTVKEGTSQRDRFRQSYCILFALFRISQLYLTCFFFPFTDVNVPRPV